MEAPKKPLYKSLYFQVICAILLGIALGHFYPQTAQAMKPLGDGFIKLIKMIIAPIIFCTVVLGVAGMEDMKKLGRIGGKALIYFEAVTTLALIIGLVVVNTLQPGGGMHVDPASLDTAAIAKYTASAQHNGFIDFLLYNLPLGIGKTRWPVYIAVGVLYFVLYYVIFRVLIVKLNLHTLGREAEGMEMKLHSKSEYKAKVAAENGTAAAPAADNTVDAAVIVEALGGKDNILKVTNCYTRLRTELADPDKVQDDVLKNQTGASAVIRKGKNVQVVYGLKVNAVRKAVDAELGLSGEE